VADVVRRFLRNLRPEHMAQLGAVFTLLGMEGAFPPWLARWNERSQNAKWRRRARGAALPAVASPSASVLSSTGVGSIVDFQLLHAGQYLPRNLQSRYDARIGSSFFPDAWQRRMLDIIDRNESALVVGPTSAGKTVISMYCIDAIHKSNKAETAKAKKKSHTGNTALPAKVLVYVSPTKALVNAEVYLRTGKQPAIFTREQRPNTLQYEVLVTVPQCLEILLLSPPRQDWTARIGYVIFDEVHCLDMTDGGVWERCIVLASRICPIIANSATIGQPEAFHAWMKELHERPMHLVRDQPASGTNAASAHEHGSFVGRTSSRSCM
jgi:hypothetical protein